MAKIATLEARIPDVRIPEEALVEIVTLGGIRKGTKVPRHDWHAREPEEPGYFSVWFALDRDTGAETSISPEDAAEAVRTGRARMKDPAAAFETVQAFGRIARYGATHLHRYEAPIVAEHEAQRAERRQRAEQVIDRLVMEHDGVPEYLSVAQVAEITGLSEDSVLRHAGRSLPAVALHIGRRHLFRSAAVFRMVLA